MNSIVDTENSLFHKAKLILLTHCSYIRERKTLLTTEMKTWSKKKKLNDKVKINNLFLSPIIYTHEFIIRKLTRFVFIFFHQFVRFFCYERRDGFRNKLYKWNIKQNGKLLVSASFNKPLTSYLLNGKQIKTHMNKYERYGFPSHISLIQMSVTAS